ncbi:SET domain-containing protein-lysine N-methyltransferase [Microdochium nivale]|nr:SET domain-containing protein-lysine N-methyltransferase [Microdochium nivale]
MLSTWLRIVVLLGLSATSGVATVVAAAASGPSGAEPLALGTARLAQDFCPVSYYNEFTILQHGYHGSTDTCGRTSEPEPLPPLPPPPPPPPAVEAPPRRRTSAGSSSRYWEIRASPGKGLGVFARVSITRGTQLMTEPPLFSVEPPPFHPGKGYNLDDMLASISDEVARLSDDERAVFEDCHEHLEEHELAAAAAAEAAAAALARNGASDGSNDQQQEQPGSKAAAAAEHARKLRHMRIFRTNAYMLPPDDAGRSDDRDHAAAAAGRSAMFPLVARINHSCAPNAANVWDRASGLRVIWASRDIAQGEEVLVSYAPLLRDTGERRARLAQYGFECDCEVCVAGVSGAGGGAREDIRRRRLGRELTEVEDALEIQKQQEQQQQDGASAAFKSKRLAKQAVKLAEEFRGHGRGELWGYLEETYDLAAEFWARAGDREASEEWRERAEEMRDLGRVRVEDGRD